jgi:GNAT superfamily N-acetyltransferase
MPGTVLATKPGGPNGAGGRGSSTVPLPAAPAVTIEPFDRAAALPARDLAQVVDIVNAAWAEWIPGEPAMSVDAYCDMDGFTHAPEVMVRHLARDAEGEVVGVGQIQYRAGEHGACGLHLFVAAEHRRNGVGTALGGALVEAARAAGRIGVTVEAAHGSAGTIACQRAGLRPDMAVEQNRARADGAEEGMLRSWVAAGEAADGYSLVAYDRRCPDDLAAAFVAARHVMNDAPRWEGEPEAVFTVGELRAAEAAAAAVHLDWWNLGVRHDASGAIVGLSEIYLPRRRPWIVFQGDTGVDPAHRGHGLGAWMKAVNHLRLRAERPHVRAVQTWNAAANEPMLRINRALGFQPVVTYQGWYLPFE